MAGPRALWVIVSGASPTAFRSRYRDDLVPTLKQLQRTQPDTRLLWFERNRFWDSPEAARAALAAYRTNKKAPDRGTDWRPGGEHKDPRAKYQLTRDEKRARFKQRLRRGPKPDRQAGGPGGPGGRAGPGAPAGRARSNGKPGRPGRSGRPDGKPDSPARPGHSGGKPGFARSGRPDGKQGGPKKWPKGPQGSGGSGGYRGRADEAKRTGPGRPPGGTRPGWRGKPRSGTKPGGRKK